MLINTSNAKLFKIRLLHRCNFPTTIGVLISLLCAGYFICMKKFTIEQINAHQPAESKLTALSFEGYKKYGSVNYSCVLCKCVCGKQKICIVKDILKGSVRSCGCLTNNPGTHNLSKEPLYHVWGDMKSRCYNKKHKSYNLYGGRGIIIYRKWKNDFVAFYNWAIVNGWESGLQIDRKNNNGNYTPRNCRFVTPVVNSNNRNTNVYIEYNNKKLTIAQWSNLLGISRQTIGYRHKQGWSTEKILS